MKTIFVVDDDTKYLHMIKDILELENFNVEVFEDPLDAYNKLKVTECNLLVTDLMMQDVSGFQLTQLVNKLDKNIPIIILTGNEDDENEIKGLNLNIADYIRKPFNVDIFLARLKNAISNIKDSNNNDILYDEKVKLKVVKSQRRVFLNNTEIGLTRKEFDVLVLLMESKNVVLSREEIIEQVWNEDPTYIDDRTVDVHIKNIRLKLKLYSIQTIYGIGYRWNG